MDQSECCPVTLEEFTPAGPAQPVFLPACGHTFSRVAVQNIIHVSRHVREGQTAGVVRCPLCQTVQPRLKADNLIPNWDTIRRVEHLKSEKAAAAKMAAAKEAEEAAAAEERERAHAVALKEAEQHTEAGSSLTPIDAIQSLFSLKQFFQPPPTLQNADLQQLCFNASGAAPGSTLDMHGRELSCATVSNWLAAAFLSNHMQVDARVLPELTLLDASTDEWAWGLTVPMDKVHLWTLHAEEVSVCNARIKLPSDGVLLMKADQKVTFYNLTLEGGTFVCASPGTVAVFESVKVTGATIVITEGAKATISRCTLTECPVAVLVHGTRSTATIRRCTARNCAAFVTATGGASVGVGDCTVEMSDCSGVGVDVRGPGSHFQAAESTIMGPTAPSSQGAAGGEGSGERGSATADAAALVAPDRAPGSGIRGINGATIELSNLVLEGFAAGLDIRGAGTVAELNGCKMHGNSRAAMHVLQGAVAEAVGCTCGQGGTKALVVQDLGSSVRAVECGFGDTSADAIVATDGAGVRLMECRVSGVRGGCAVAASGTGSRVRCMDCTMSDNEREGLSVTTAATAVLTSCKLLRSSEGHGVLVDGGGSRCELEGCELEDNRADGVCTSDWGTLVATNCNIRGSGRCGVRAADEGASAQLADCCIGRCTTQSVAAMHGGTVKMERCEVGLSEAGLGLLVAGAGAGLQVTGTKVEAEQGAVVALRGGTAEVSGCHLSGGVRAAGEATRLQLSDTEVQGVSVQKGSAEISAERCSFTVRPQALQPERSASGRSGTEGEGAGEAGSAVAGRSADSCLQLTACTWQIESLKEDELRMYVRGAEWLPGQHSRASASGSSSGAGSSRGTSAMHGANERSSGSGQQRDREGGRLRRYFWQPRQLARTSAPADASEATAASAGSGPGGSVGREQSQRSAASGRGAPAPRPPAHGAPLVPQQPLAMPLHPAGATARRHVFRRESTDASAYAGTSTEGSGSIQSGDAIHLGGLRPVPLERLTSENARQQVSADAAQAETTLAPHALARNRTSSRGAGSHTHARPQPAQPPAHASPTPAPLAPVAAGAAVYESAPPSLGPALQHISHIGPRSLQNVASSVTALVGSTRAGAAMHVAEQSRSTAQLGVPAALVSDHGGGVVAPMTQAQSALQWLHSTSRSSTPGHALTSTEHSLPLPQSVSPQALYHAVQAADYALRGSGGDRSGAGGNMSPEPQTGTTSRGSGSWTAAALGSTSASPCTAPSSGHSGTPVATPVIPVSQEAPVHAPAMHNPWTEPPRMAQQYHVSTRAPQAMHGDAPVAAPSAAPQRVHGRSRTTGSSSRAPMPSGGDVNREGSRRSMLARMLPRGRRSRREA